MDQLKEMETICQKEGELLCQQHDMVRQNHLIYDGYSKSFSLFFIFTHPHFCPLDQQAFVEFVHKLAEILERKARCVHNMRTQLRAYLKTNHHSTEENYENAIM